MKVLFVFHHAGITGAALLLYSTVQWLHKNTDIQMSFLLRDNGPLITELPKYGDVYEWDKPSQKPPHIFSRIKNKLFGYRTPQLKLIEQLQALNFDVIYYNTILCSSIIKKTAHFSAKKIWHIHELELAIHTHGKEHLNSYKYIDCVLANSKSTAKNLVNNGFKNNVNVIYPFIDLQIINQKVNGFNAKESLNIPENAFVIVTSGSVIETKGVQSFLSLPIIINHLLPNNNFYFLWVGNYNAKQKAMVDYDIQKAKIQNKIVFVGEQKNPFPYYNLADVFVSTSKEESFGLSVVEAAFLNKPVVCFKNTGGIEELVSSSENITIDYLDTYQMALAIIKLYNNPSMIKELGEKGHQFSKKYDTEYIMPKMYEFLKTASISE